MFLTKSGPLMALVGKEGPLGDGGGLLMKAGASCFILMLPELSLRLPWVGPGAWVAAQGSGSLGRGAAFGGLWVSLLQ